MRWRSIFWGAGIMLSSLFMELGIWIVVWVLFCPCYPYFLCFAPDMHRDRRRKVTKKGDFYSSLFVFSMVFMSRFASCSIAPRNKK
ncbi:MAG: hypothetical protein JWQ38_2036 [Flavipsychrobacter sp.]|nr:hypothetical protein [Flavipsychrobacter sp.]